MGTVYLGTLQHPPRGSCCQGNFFNVFYLYLTSQVLIFNDDLGTVGLTACSGAELPDSLKYVLDTTVKMVNFVKARPLNSRVFSVLCNNMGSNNATLLQHTEVRWLSRGKVLTRFFKLRDKLSFLY